MKVAYLTSMYPDVSHTFIVREVRALRARGVEVATFSVKRPRDQNIIGDDLRIWGNAVIDYGCRIGNNVRIHNQVYVSQFTSIEDDVFLAPGVILANDIHPGCPDSLECMEGPHIKRGAQIGINVTILPRVVIGERAVIGAGSVVTKDIPPGVVVYGNPAQPVCQIGDLICTTGRRDKPYL